MQALKEITVWKGVSRQCNHTYLMAGSKCVAYLQWHEGQPFYFSKPMPLDRRGRKFVELDTNPFDLELVAVDTHVIRVKGSKGEEYRVDTQAGTCTCPGYTYRGACKHTKLLEAA